MQRLFEADIDRPQYAVYLLVGRPVQEVLLDLDRELAVGSRRDFAVVVSEPGAPNELAG
jgi:hypothetical protein